MIFPITYQTGGYFGIGLTKFLQVVHGVHVVHSLAIEVEPGERNRITSSHVGLKLVRVMRSGVGIGKLARLGFGVKAFCHQTWSS